MRTLRAPVPPYLRRAVQRRRWRTAAALLPVGLLAAGALLAGLAGLLLAPHAGAQQAREALLVFDRALQGEGESELRWPVAVASGGADELAVADAWGSRLLLWRHGADGWRAVRSVELPEAPAALAWDGGRYVVSLRGGAGLVAAEGDGLALRRLPLPDGGVAGPLAAHPEGGVLVYDHAGEQVLRVDGDGRPGEPVPVSGHVTALAAAAGGRFYTAVGDRAALRLHAADGTVEESWSVPPDGPVPGWPSALAVTAGGDVVVIDRHAGRVVVFRTDGTLVGFGARAGWEPGLLRFPAGLALLADGRLAVADQGNGRVQIFRWRERGS